MRQFILISVLTFAVAACSNANLGRAAAGESLIDSLRNDQSDISREPVVFQKFVQSYRSGRCYIHQSPMIRRWIPVVHEMNSEGVPEEVQSSLFPFSPTKLFSSLILLTPDKTKVVSSRVEMFVCRDCELAYDVWSRDRKKPNKAPEPTPGSVTPRATEEALK